MEANIAAALAITKEKEREREMLLLKEKEREREKEKEREGEMEAALYTNCLLLGLDASVLGHNVGTRVGLFKHSNPRVGEALLHFLLSSLRGPTLAAKDFAGVWPIFDAAQSRDFRKIVQSLINELEAHGALPRSNSRVSSLATCCGQRFVELLWQLSAHTLREVHKRSFPADVAANPLPASLTEVVSQNSHAASLLAVTKARIALERKRFVEGASAAVRRQAVWSSLANDLTAEHRALCAEEAYLQQELEKMQTLQDVQDLQDWQARKSGGGANFSTSGYALDEEAMSMERASVLWDSLLSHAEQHEKLASGPVEDLISHREHRYRIDGSALRTAINRGASAVPVDSSVEFISLRSSHEDEGLLRPGSSDGSRLDSSSISEGNFIDENRGRGDERPGKLMSQLDVAEIIRRWTHALHRLHKQALRLARANDGAGPELLKDALGLTENGHAQAVQATVAEHRHHLANLQILVVQLKDSIPGMEDAVAALWDQVNSSDMVKACLAAQSALSSPLPHETRHVEREGDAPVDGDELIYGMRPLDFVPPSPALKLPQLLSTSPSSLEKIAGLQKRFSSFSHMFPLESLREEDLSRAASITDSSIEYGSDAGEESMMALRQTLREAALSQPAAAPEVPIERLHHTVAEHYFTPIVQPSNNKIFEDKKVDVVFGKQRSYNTLMPYRSLSSHPSMDMSWDATEDLKGSSKLHTTKDTDRPSSPPLLMDLSTFGDAYDDLLAPMSELDML